MLLLTIALLRGAAVTTLLRRATVATLRGMTTSVSLLILSIVRRVDGSKNELENPKIRGEVDGRVGASHLSGLVLEVRRYVYHASTKRLLDLDF